MNRVSTILLVALAAAVLATGVRAADTLHTETECGPVKIAVDLDPKEPRLSDEPTLTLTVTAANGVRVELPEFGESLGEFIIRDFYEPLRKTADGKQILQQVYTLEPTHAGSLTVEPLTVTFVDERPDGDGQQHSIETEALKLTVATMIASEAPSLNDLRPAAAPVELPEPSKAAFVWTGIFAALLAAVAGVFLWRRFRNKKPTEPVFTPQQLAWRELNELLSGKLSERDVKEFFVQLTGVVRRYIERSTGVRAPEQTTDEFLRAVTSKRLFSGEDDRRLCAFLESADLVKFAGYQPDPENIKQSTHLAKQFIELKTMEVSE